MNVDRLCGVGLDTAERLLDGARADPQDGLDTLARLLAATCAPASPGEFVGEEATLDAFRAMHLGPVPQTRRSSMLETALAKLLTLKVAGAAAVTVAATGGVALAAGNGVLPNPLSSETATVQQSTSPAPGKPAAAGETGKPAPSPSPNLVGLCRAYTAGAAASNPGKAAENPAFTVLITAAGDKEKVAAYCDALLGADKGGHTVPTARPTGRPDSSTAPAGKPDSLPTDASEAPARGTRPSALPTAPPTS